MRVDQAAVTGCSEQESPDIRLSTQPSPREAAGGLAEVLGEELSTPG